MYTVFLWLPQARMSRVYPLYSGTFLMCACAAVQCAVYAMSRERDWSEWRLGWNIRLLTVIYTVIGVLFFKYFSIDIFNMNNPIMKNKINLICFFINNIISILMIHMVSSFSIWVVTSITHCWIAGSCWHWSNGFTNGLGFNGERPNICIFFLSINAYNGCGSFIAFTRWEATFGKVWIIKINYSVLPSNFPFNYILMLIFACNSLIGAVLIIIGLYVVLWGKGKEMKKTTQLDGSKSFRGSGLGDVDLGTSSRDGNRLSPELLFPPRLSW